MAITSYSQARFGDVVTVTAVSSLSGTVYFHWYVDGAFVATTKRGTHTIALEPGDQVRIDAIDTTDAGFDPIANAPEGWPARRTIWWIRSLDDDVASYRVEMQIDGGAWSTIGKVPSEAGRWHYSLLSPRLADLTDHGFRVVPVDVAGNDGSALTVESGETVVRRPDAPEFGVTFDGGTSQVTFAAA